MKFMLLTEKGENGGLTVQKSTICKSTMYKVKTESGEVGEVDKDFILEHQKDFINLGISADGKIYAVEVKADKSKNQGYSVVLYHSNYGQHRVRMLDEFKEVSVENIKIATDTVLGYSGILKSAGTGGDGVKFVLKNKAKAFTSKTDKEKVLENVRKNKVCLYQEQGRGSKINYLVVHVSMLDFAKAEYTIEMDEINGHPMSDIAKTGSIAIPFKAEVIGGQGLYIVIDVVRTRNEFYDMQTAYCEVSKALLDRVSYDITNRARIETLSGLSNRALQLFKQTYSQEAEYALNFDEKQLRKLCEDKVRNGDYSFMEGCYSPTNQTRIDDYISKMGSILKKAKEF